MRFAIQAVVLTLVASSCATSPEPQSSDRPDSVATTNQPPTDIAAPTPQESVVNVGRGKSPTVVAKPADALPRSLEDVVQEHMQAGRNAVESFDYTTAAAEFEKVIELEPTHYEAQLLLGTAYFEMEQGEKAIACFQTIADSLPADTSDLPANSSIRKLAEITYLQLGRTQYYLQSDYEAALRAFTTATSDLEDAVDPELLYVIGYCQYQVGQFDQAIQTLEERRYSVGADGATLNLLGLCFECNGQLELAMGDFERALNESPANTDAANNLARLRALSDHPTAKEMVAALRSYPRLANPWQVASSNWTNMMQWNTDWQQDPELQGLRAQATETAGSGARQ